MGNFEKLSVLVIVVIIVMILVVAIYEWTGSPSDGASTPGEMSKVETPTSLPNPEAFPLPAPGPDGGKGTTSQAGPKPEEWFNDPSKLIPEDTKRLSVEKDAKDKDGSPAGKPLAVTPVDPPKVEGTEIPETVHVVVSGDTLGAISKKYYNKASLYPRIEEANPGVTATTLRVGQKLKIPALKIEAGKAAPALASATKSDDTASESSGDRPVPGKEYKVKASDTWERISKAAYKTSERWPEIYVKNMKLTPSPRDLRAGLVLVIPR